MNNADVVEQTAGYVKTKLMGEGSGHDWWHIYRVWQTAVHIGERETADMFVVQLAALLHDIADWKFHGGDLDAGPKAARVWLEQLNIAEVTINHICRIIKNASFKGAGATSPLETIEGMIVQDADRLDAIGAIGIARTFAYGGHKGRELYNPDIKPVLHGSFEEYKSSVSPTVNHFYEKLLLLKDRMNTETAKQIAEERHRFMEEFLARFFKEWEGRI